MTVSKVIACPNCGRDSVTTSYPAQRNALPPIVTVEVCASCGLLWFDHGSFNLAPESVIALFRYIAALPSVRANLKTQLDCARCDRPLQFIHDLQRATRFTYWRCDRDHGQLITFQNFLREKNFIRTPGAAELAKLRETVRQITCSQCGAPIDLGSDSACRHCGAAVALVDPDGVAKALREFASAARSTVGPDDASRVALADASSDGGEARAMRDLLASTPQPRADLLAYGLELVADWLAERLG